MWLGFALCVDLLSARVTLPAMTELSAWVQRSVRRSPLRLRRLYKTQLTVNLGKRPQI
jgi:hypothetical protein